MVSDHPILRASWMKDEVYLEEEVDQNKTPGPACLHPLSKLPLPRLHGKVAIDVETYYLTSSPPII